MRRVRTSILRRNGRISVEASRAATPWQRFEHLFPNDLWQMDFKGYFGTNHEGRCHPLAIRPFALHSCLDAQGNERHESVRAALLRVFGRYASILMTVRPGATVGKAR